MKIKALIIGVLFGITVSANADPASMQEVFDQINARGNVTQPTAIQGQTMNYMTGGSLFMRTPNTTYNLAAITPPSANAGCGGIDLYMGGFSFVNKEQFVAMLKNIGSNALGYGFKLALQNLCPTCDNVLQALQSASQQINRMNIDSCEAAKGIVNAATSTVALRGREQSSMNFGTSVHDKNR
ncbi:conjugal transfer protein TraH [Acinetobacter baumannii]